MNRLLVAAVLTLAALPAAAQSNIRNAKLQERPAGDLARTFDQLANEAGPVWIGYAVPAQNPDWNSCCYHSWNDGNTCCGRCSLEQRKDRESITIGDDRPRGPIQLEGSAEAVILYRVENRDVERIRSYSPSCEIDAGGRTLYWLTGVEMPASVALLKTFAGKAPAMGDRKDKLADGALLAISAHRHQAADRALEELMRPGNPTHTRRQAAFWSGHSRGKAGFELVRNAIMADRDDEDFRKHAVFAISQSDVPEAADTLVQLAKNDTSSRIRGEAIFWLAQKAGRKAAGAITDAIENDPDTKVKERAVFALSQLPKDEGVPKLIDVARTNRNPKVRQQAMFWLGQSKDPRALRFFEEILLKD